MKTISLALIFITITFCSFSQPVFTYGKNSVSKEEFIKAFNKNPNGNPDRRKALKEYLDLYIKFKLKVQAAYDAGLDKDPGQKVELENFSSQIADNIINEEANLKALVKEAFERSQKEVHLANVFIEVPGNADTIEAYKNIYAAYKLLQQGQDFGNVSQQYSTDEATKQAKGDLGFISVFTLPYDLETIAYSLKVNTISLPFKTKAGYIIFKNLGERKSLGTRKVAQILITMPPQATVEDKSSAGRKADSLYKLLQKGASFEDLAAKTSNDLSSNDNKGELPEFSTGTYSPDFEKVAFGLQKPGDISKPFQTSFGYHILKLIQAKAAAATIDDPTVLSELEEKVTKDNRMEKSKSELLQKKLSLIKFKQAKFNQKDLFSYTDSAISKENPRSIKGIDQRVLLFSFAKKNVKVSDWIAFVRTIPNASPQNLKDNYSQLYREFIEKSTDDYYRKNLADYNNKFAQQVKEFKEANLLFGVMEKNVWSRASADTAGLIQYYKLHKAKYTWPPSADAIIVTCKTLKLAGDMQQKLKDSLSSWRKITNSAGDVVADSGRFELGQLAVLDRTNFTPGLLTAPVKNTSDETYTFNYVIKVYGDPAQRSFEDARGMVITDYQQVLEDNWIKELKNKYPVKVNELVFSTIR